MESSGGLIVGFISGIFVGVFVACLILYVLGSRFDFADKSKSSDDGINENIPSSQPNFRAPLVEKFRDQLMRQRAESPDSFEPIFSSVLAQYSDVFGKHSSDITLDEAFLAASRAQFPLSEIVHVMFKNFHYPLSSVVDFLNNNGNLNVGDIFAVIAPLADGQTSLEKAEVVLDSLEKRFELDEDVACDLFSRITSFDPALSAIAIVVLLYQKTASRLVPLLLFANLVSFPKTSASIARELGVDFCKEESEYQFLRDSLLSRSAIFSLLRAYGNNAFSILNAEHNFCSVDISDFSDLIHDLSIAGFSNQEIFEAMWVADFSDDLENADGAIVAAWCDAGVSLSEIIDFLLRKDFDLQDLAGELEEVELDFEQRIKILHGVLLGRAILSEIQLTPPIDSSDQGDPVS